MRFVVCWLSARLSMGNILWLSLVLQKSDRLVGAGKWVINMKLYFCMSVIFRDVIFKHIKLLVHFSELLERLWSVQDTNLRILHDTSLGAVWAMWLFKYFPGKCYCGDLRAQEDVLCIAPTCNIGLLNIVDTGFECCTVSIVGAGNIKEKKFGGSVWQGGNVICHNDFSSNVSVWIASVWLRIATGVTLLMTW